MGYSRSLTTLRKIEHLLEPLKRGEETSWQIDTSFDPRAAERWASKVREALAIAAMPAYQEAVPELHAASGLFSIHVEKNLVTARRTQNTPEAVIIAGGASRTPTHGLEPAGRPATLPNASLAREIVQFWLARQGEQPSNDPMLFPESRLTDQELDKLARWAALRTPPWIVVKPRDSRAITLMPYDEGAVAAGVTWPVPGGTGGLPVQDVGIKPASKEPQGSTIG
jgi:hypothetical protein